MAGPILSVRDQLWLLAHDDRYTTLRPLVDVRALNIGLIAATLADLLIADRIHINRGRIFVKEQLRGPLNDPIATAVLAALADDYSPYLTQVLRGARADQLGDEPNPYQGGYDRTQAALIAAGHVREQRRRIGANRFHLVDDGLIAAIRSRLNHRLVYGDRNADVDTDCLCALVLALQLHGSLVTPFGAVEAERILRFVVSGIALRVGNDAPLAVMPQLADAVTETVGDLATAPF